MCRWKLSYSAFAPLMSMAYRICFSAAWANMLHPSMPLGTSLEVGWSRYSYLYFSQNKTKVALTGTVAKMIGFRTQILNLLNHNVWEWS